MRETYVLRNGRLVPKGTAAPLNPTKFHVLPDITPFRTQDGTEISSRSSLRAYEQRHGVKQIGNDNATQMMGIRQKVYGDRP